MRISALIIPLLVLPCLCAAFDLKDIDASLTRAKSDQLLSKDYSFKVLSDLSIRRTWVDGNRTIILDYMAAGDRLICAEIRYKTPLTVSKALLDAELMTKKPLPLQSWQKPKSSQIKMMDLDTCRYVPLDDKQSIYIELPKKGKASALLFFTQPPVGNRRALEEAQPSVNIGFGVTADASAAEDLIKDEKNRLSRPAQAIAQQPTSSPTPAVGEGDVDSSLNVTTTTTLTVTTTPLPSQHADTSSQPSTEIATSLPPSLAEEDPVTTPIAPKSSLKDLVESLPLDKTKKAVSWYEDLTLQEWAGIAGLLLFSFILMIFSSSASHKKKLAAEIKRREEMIREQRAIIAQGKEQEKDSK